MLHLEYIEIAKRIAQHPLMAAELPTAMYVSMPLPTLRWGGPGYASFSAPTSRQPDQTAIQGAPDRWWLFDAGSARLKVYALTSCFPFAPDALFSDVEIPSLKCPPVEFRALLAETRERMAPLARCFLEKQIADSTSRSNLRDLLRQIIPVSIEDRHRALAPDFFDWLEA
jgi:hypothetical protein